MIYKLATALALFSLVACNKQEPTPAPADVAVKPSAAASPTPPPVEAAREPTVDVAALPVEEEFEAEAAAQLTSANLDATLDALEKEINAQ
jgi:hypothetical protein